MASANGFIKGARLAGKGVLAVIDAVGIKDLVQLGGTLTQQGIEAGTKARANRMEEKKSLVKIPDISHQDYEVSLDDAKRWLEEDGFRVEAVSVKPNAKYRECTENEVVATNYRRNQKVKRGERIILQYVTAETIAASRRLFEESERIKHEKLQMKSEIKAQRKADQTRLKEEKSAVGKQKIDKVTGDVQQGLSDAVKNTQEGVKKIVSKVRRREKL